MTSVVWYNFFLVRILYFWIPFLLLFFQDLEGCMRDRALMGESVFFASSFRHQLEVGSN